MDTIGTRLKAERQRLKKNQDDFAAAGGVKKRAQISYEQDERSPDALYLASLAGIGVDVWYVLTGEQSASALTADENELLSGYRDLDVRGKAGVLGMISGMMKQEPGNQATFHGDVGQAVQGDQTVAGPLNFNVGRKKPSK